MTLVIGRLISRGGSKENRKKRHRERGDWKRKEKYIKVFLTTGTRGPTTTKTMH